MPVSFCVGEGYGSAFYLSDVYTAENFRGQGYAAAAVLAMLGFARNPDMGYTDVFLYADDPAAIRLYEKLGFRGTPVREYRAFKGGLPDLYTEAKE
ncbi:MAG: GNAT family N-acetyltransferase [Ruthenibacterium lactatiformans]